jgi:anthranilate synthase component 1
MKYLSEKEFLRLTQKGNVIPVYKEVNADLETPVSAFLKIKKDKYAFLLESVEGQEKIARYSFLGSKPRLVFLSKGKKIQITYPHKKKVLRFISEEGPLVQIKKIMQDFKAVQPEGLARFYGGLVGYMGYDTVRFFEKIPDKNRDDLNLPDCLFLLTDTILIFDHAIHTIKIVNNVILPKKSMSLAAKKKIYRQAIKKIDQIEHELSKAVTVRRPNKLAQKPKIESNFKRREFLSIVKKAKEYIRKGEIIQVVLSQRFKLKNRRDPFEIYRNLRSLNPSPYMYFLEFDDLKIVGASPEMLVRCEDGVIQTRPIAGTRRRGRSQQEDKILAEELLRDKKELAEHLMLVDLGRNDLGRVSISGKVEVSEFMAIEKYSHVMHLVSEVRGRLERKRYDIFDVLKAAFPAGTVSGSPKIRAMQIIDELENIRRGPYAGCIGYFSFSHNMDTCITIRTVVLKDGYAYIQAGAGIVADSVPKNEYLESVNKARALVEAVVQ